MVCSSSRWCVHVKSNLSRVLRQFGQSRVTDVERLEPIDEANCAILGFPGGMATSDVQVKR